MGSQNWSDDYREKFLERFNYDPVKFLPVFSGRIVGSVDESDRFLWDLRRLTADLVAYEYVGGLKKVSNDHNLKLWLENYGHWGFPSEFLLYGGQSDLISGEYWSGIYHRHWPCIDDGNGRTGYSGRHYECR